MCHFPLPTSKFAYTSVSGTIREKRAGGTIFQSLASRLSKGSHMLAQDTYEFRNSLSDRGIIFCYSGYMTEGVLSGIGNALRTKLALDETERTRARRLFAVFVEQVQNVVRYSEEREPSEEQLAKNSEEQVKELRYGVLTVGVNDEQYFVSCANLVKLTDVDRLKDSLEHIQHLDKDGLKALYKETLRGETPKGSKGAGVGFIDIARRATQGFEYDFMEINDKHAYFCLKAYV